MTYTKITTAIEDQALTFLLAERNQRAPVPLTLDQLVQAGVDGWFADRVAEYNQKVQAVRRAKESLFTPADKATVDAIYAKYVDPLTGL